MTFFHPLGCLSSSSSLWSAAFSLLASVATVHAAVVGPAVFEWDPNPENDIAGYKFYIGNSSRAYTDVRDAGNDHQISITDLEEGEIYYFAVTAYNEAGQESTFSQELILNLGAEVSDPNAGGRIVLLEAEDGVHTTPMAVFSGPEESWIDTQDYSQLGTTTLSFNVPRADDYQIWCRVKAPTADRDSLFAMLNGSLEHVFHIYGTPEPAEGTRTDAWVWKRIHNTGAGPRSYTLSEGDHTLRFRVREPGTLLDRVVLSTDPGFVPDDALPRSGDAVVILEEPGNQSRQIGESATLQVKAAATGPIAFQWNKDGAAISNASAAVLNLVNLQASDSGDYSVSVASGGASATSEPAALTVGIVIPTSDFKVTKLTMNPDQTVSFVIEGGSNVDVEVHASSNLSDWEHIGTRLNENGIIHMEDPEGAGETKRFYRLVLAD